MTFGEAIEAMKNGKCVQREGWNGKNMYIYLEGSFRSKDGFTFEPAIVMFTAQGKYQPGWLANQPDMLADDWEIINK